MTEAVTKEPLYLVPIRLQMWLRDRNKETIHIIPCFGFFFLIVIEHVRKKYMEISLKNSYVPERLATFNNNYYPAKSHGISPDT